MSDSNPKPPGNKDSIWNILVVALSVCLFFAVLVSVTAVSLKPAREANVEQDRNRNILEAAGMYREGVTDDGEIPALFEQFEVQILDLERDAFLWPADLFKLDLDPVSYDPRKGAKDPHFSRALSRAEDPAGISRQARFMPVYLLREGERLDRIVLPIHGYGLWSILHGFIALEGDARTVVGITFHEHQETPGLGGEVDNPRWKSLWKGKLLYASSSATPELRVMKGAAAPDDPHQVDGLSGATLTTRGVDNLVRFWMGEEGYGPFLDSLRRTSTHQG